MSVEQTMGAAMGVGGQSMHGPLGTCTSGARVGPVGQASWTGAATGPAEHTRGERRTRQPACLLPGMHSQLSPKT